MATQLQFSRRAYGSVEGSYDGSAGSAALGSKVSPRHVAFAVHDAVPSPQLYLHQQRQKHRESDEVAAERFGDRPEEGYSYATAAGIDSKAQLSQPSDVPRWIEPTQQKKAAMKKPIPKSINKTNKKNAIPAKPIRRPGWEPDARPSSTLFDASLKKNSLFQPRAGDRIREEEEEARAMRETGSRNGVERRKASSSSVWNERIAKSLPSQPRRQQKDYVKMNMEKITGQRYETLMRRSQKSKTVPAHRGSVFDRLGAPVIHKSLLHFRSPSPTRSASTVQPHLQVKRDEKVVGLSPAQLTIATPVVLAPVPELSRSPPRQTSSRRSPLSRRSSPNRDRISTPQSARMSTSTRGSSPKFRLDASARDQNRTMAEKVFEVLDRHGRGRIGVEQIVDGLRLLQLPATHNQVSDYVYLIHEGSRNTISLEEWAILVGTLDAASETTMNVPSQPAGASIPSPSFGRLNRSPPRSQVSTRCSPPRSYNQMHSPPKMTETTTEHNDSPALSDRMPESNLSKISAHSEDLANLLMDDLLLEIVEDLNKHERHQAIKAHQRLEVDALDSILMQIQRIEQVETQLIENGMALCYESNPQDKVLSRMGQSAAVRKPSEARTEYEEEGESLVLPLGVVMGISDEEDILSPSILNGPVDGNSQRHRDRPQLLPPELHEVQDVESCRTCPQTASVSMACLGGRLFQSIEKSRARFMKHRRLVESSLESTGMDQASVIEMLADLLLDEIAIECAIELEDGVETLTETLAQSLL